MEGRSTVTVATAERVTFLCCQFCPYKTRFTGNLAKHIRTHTGERPFVCPFCGKSFASKSNYNTHVIIHTTPGGRLRYRNGGERFRGGRLRRSNSTRPYDDVVNAGIVRNIPVVKSLLSKRLFPRSSSTMSQQLSPIGSFLMPPQNLNAGFSRAAFYSSLNFSSFGGLMSCKNNDSDSVAAAAAFSPTTTGGSIDVDVSDMQRTLTEYDNDDNDNDVVSFVSNSNDDEILTISDEDVKPSIVDILNILRQNANKMSSVRRRRNHERRHLAPEFKQERLENDAEMEEEVDAGVHHHHRHHLLESGWKRKRKNESDFSPTKSSKFRNVNGDCSISASHAENGAGEPVYPKNSAGEPVYPKNGAREPVYPENGAREPVYPSLDQPDDENRLHTQMLINTLIKESRLYRCEACNILFPDYSVYVLHRGCHGNDSEYQCHFCRHSFNDKFSFLAHFVRCPHEETNDT